MSDFNLFRNEVLSLYKEKKELGLLHSKFDDPSPANLRQYCLVVLSKGLTDEDKNIMQEFYNPVNRYATLEEAIVNVGISRLRSLQNLIIGTTTNPTDDLLVKLLAVLVDYQPRPFVLGKWKPKEEREKDVSITKGNDLIDEKKPQEGESSTYGDGNDENFEVPDIRKRFTNEIIKDGNFMRSGVMAPSPPRARKWYSKKWFYLISIATGIVTVFIGWIYMKPNQCMLWNEDHYIEVDCAGQTNLLGVQKVPLDQERLNNFKKIMRPDTLSVKHVNKVWYSKIDHKVDFFTSSGFHPEHPDRSLKAATEHILTKYAGDSARIASQHKEAR